ncbi:MAG TPA: VOC family protein [Burkholderiales bacterium]|nr:VOC family protein [Burkholderiales bacterium]
MFQILGLDHVVLRVNDLPRMVRFYCEVLGCRIEREREDLGLMQLRAGQSMIDLVAVGGELGKHGGAGPGREGRNMDHLCLRVEPFDAGGIAAHLIRHGVVPGETKLRYGAEGEGFSMYLSDPEGNTVELKGPPAREARQRRGS